VRPVSIKACLLLFTVCWLAMPSGTEAQIGGGNNSVKLTGTVFSKPGNRPIDRAMIRLTDPGGNLIQQSATNDSGEFAFRDLARGRYVLEVEAIGYERAEIHVDLSFMSEKGIAVELGPEKKETPDVTPAGKIVSAHEMSMPQFARELVSSGREKLYTEKKTQESLADFERAVAKAPGYYEAYYEMAMAQAQLGRTQDAEESFRKSIEVSGDKYGDASIGLGTLLFEKGRTKEAELDLGRGVQLNPNSWLGHFQLGKIELSENRLDDAQKSAELAKTLAPNAPIIYRLLANIHMKQGDYPALLQDLDSYIKLDPDSPAGLRARELRAQVLQKIENQSSNTQSPRTP
jgi:tetratricopeptide (TPR) repeat protein